MTFDCPAVPIKIDSGLLGTDSNQRIFLMIAI